MAVLNNGDSMIAMYWWFVYWGICSHMSLNMLGINQNGGFYFHNFIINPPITKIKLANFSTIRYSLCLSVYVRHAIFFLRYYSSLSLSLPPSPSLSLSLPLSLPLTIISNINAIDCTVFPSPISSASIQFCLVYQLNSSQLSPSN